MAQALGAIEDKRGSRSILAIAEASSNFTKGRVAALAEASISLSRSLIRKSTVLNAVPAEEGEMSSVTEGEMSSEMSKGGKNVQRQDDV